MRRYTITIFEDTAESISAPISFHSDADWGEYRKSKGLEPGVAIECSHEDVCRWSHYILGYKEVQAELRALLKANTTTPTQSPSPEQTPSPSSPPDRASPLAP